MGADAVLLIAACLTPEQCLMFAELAHTLNMEVLLEIHSKEELDHLNPFVDMLGVNNRNLGTFILMWKTPSVWQKRCKRSLVKEIFLLC